MNGAGVKSQGANREVVKVPLEFAVLETQDDSSKILLVGEMCGMRYLVVPPLEFELSPTLPHV